MRKRPTGLLVSAATNVKRCSAWAASPSVALGYAMFGIVCVAYAFLPGAKDPVEVDESDVVAGH